ncbi:winged helix-turn-helix domain-containing protein [Micromonospora sp. DSM 115977]|uniref:Winged helix-turn-helix domain-containing protein n=1 Tax=Micromonospora reichwaldensis TaxID=3075516 RepID=A0ABU2WSG6_9ACTN|nr:winged helix-turn-helix domain-containing protein [Micromonospora sp. DSM 115977]MDT0528853.1 winged helix-turn-helix domain-containing protein [Micromonospora sp. DSM 115977]
MIGVAAESAPGVGGEPEGVGMRGVAPLVIGIASSPAERRQLARLLGGTEALLIVSSVDQARTFLGVPGTPVLPPVPLVTDRRVATAEPVVTAGPVAAGPVVTAEPVVTAGPVAAGPVVTAEAVVTAEPGLGVGTPPPTDLSVDSDRRVLRWLDREVELTRLEHDFLRCLVGAPGQVWTYERLHLEVWGNVHLGRGSDMHSVVRRVRRKLARLDASASIHAVRGVGFRLASI